LVCRDAAATGRQHSVCVAIRSVMARHRDDDDYDDNDNKAEFDRLMVTISHALIWFQTSVVSDKEHHDQCVARLQQTLPSLKERSQLLCAQAAFAETVHVIASVIALRTLSIAFDGVEPAAFDAKRDGSTSAAVAHAIDGALLARVDPSTFGPRDWQPDVRNWLPYVPKVENGDVVAHLSPAGRDAWAAKSMDPIMPYQALTLVPGELDFWLNYTINQLYVSEEQMFKDMAWQYLGFKPPMRTLIRHDVEIVAAAVTTTLACAF